MIIQNFTQGSHDIRIESAETLEDAKENNFPEGIYSRQFIDDKPTESQLDLMNFIIKQTRENNSKFIPENKDIHATRKKILLDQKARQIEQLKNLKKQYKDFDAPMHILDSIDSMVENINSIGVRVIE